MHSSRFSWGDTVRVSANAPEAYRPGALGSICGMRTITTRETAELFACQMGTMVYTVEFSDGLSLEVSDQYLEGVE